MSHPVVLRDVRVLDGDTTGPATSVVVRDGRIADGPLPDDADIVEGGGGVLLPGLIDTHAHVSRRAHLDAMVEWGVTTVLDMGAPHYDATMALKDQPGLPTLRSAGRPASGPGSMFVTKMGHPASSAVSGPDDAARFVADRVAESADYIKIIIEDPRFPGTKPLEPATIAAIAVAARAAGLLTVAHVVSPATLRTAVAAGVDVVTHTALTKGLGDDEITGTVSLIPTLGMMDGVARSIGRRLPVRALSLLVPALRMDYRHAVATVAAFRRAGQVVLAGTDANDEPGAPCRVPYGISLHDELERLVSAGLTATEALRAATVQPAETFGLHDRGVIAAGRRADLVLVDGDPTRDITATRAIRGVWIGGARVRA
ncbi:amidohydrolase family protein [Actinoplanes sp. Pm04-4]|uniref:Amidohydrolase family protein n=1 Tax=Paractinoplanes pyxinae TaxID=2997416 RepID=A0ABT4BAX6_9ACTN|nr:amidohydrolase family protein [Actinoplanes pyxinae]MCY1143677.1 amidohydrolase family protein [Actinoplanes pyxinae]